MLPTRIYTLGFLFRAYQGILPAIFRPGPPPSEVALITKARPDWQAGKLNGIGGKLEPTDANPHAAQVREFKQETGLLIPTWRHFCDLCHPETGVVIHAFTAWERNAGELTPEEGAQEEPEWYTTSEVLSTSFPHPIIDNLRWLIPLALDESTSFVDATSPDPSNA